MSLMKKTFAAHLSMYATALALRRQTKWRALFASQSAKWWRSVRSSFREENAAHVSCTRRTRPMAGLSHFEIGYRRGLTLIVSSGEERAKVLTAQCLLSTPSERSACDPLQTFGLVRLRPQCATCLPSRDLRTRSPTIRTSGQNSVFTMSRLVSAQSQLPWLMRSMTSLASSAPQTMANGKGVASDRPVIRRAARRTAIPACT